MTGTVISFPKSQRSAPDELFENSAVITKVPPPGTGHQRTAPYHKGANALDLIPIDILYPAVEANGAAVLRALPLLGDAIRHLEAARAVFDQDPIEADMLVQQVQALLPKLFSCRAIGDGFGLVVNSVHFAFANQHGNQLAIAQINSVSRALKGLRVGPFLSFEQGLQSVADLEDVGLQVDPAPLADLLEESEDE
jgi:hypothetical protein